MRSHFILYVADQAASTRFYTAVLGVEPRLDVPGMTEFSLGPEVVLGLMPESGIRRLLGRPCPTEGLRCEVYLVVPDAGRMHARALAAGASELSPLGLRDWGEYVAYSLDGDGHVLACASEASL